MKNARGIILSEDETVIREYEASYIQAPKSEGYVIATNRRVIFTGSTSSAMGSSIIVRDTKIDTITGVVGGLTRKKSIVQIIIGMLIALVGLIWIFNDFGIIPLIILALGGYIAYRGLSAGGVQMYLSILSSQATPAINVAVESSRGLFARIYSHDAVMTVAASGPGKHTEQMIREIGALVQDIQVMGDLAIDKWVNKPISSEPVQPITSPSEHFSTTLDTLKQTASKVKDTAVMATETVAEASKKVTENKKTLQKIIKCTCGTTLSVDAEFCTECGQKQQENIFG